MKITLFIFISILSIFLSLNLLEITNNNVNWEKIEEGLFYSKIIYGHGISKGQIHFLKVQSPRKIKILHNNFNKTSLASLEKIYKPLAIINGGYFQPNYKPSGLLKIDNKILYPLNKYGNKGIIGISNDFVDIFDKKYFDKKKHLFREMLQNGPLLLENGKLGIYSDDKDYRSRTCICLDKNKNIFIIVVDSLASVSLFELANIAKKINCYKAINLDGGSSTGIRINTYNKRLISDSLVKISNAIAIF